MKYKYNENNILVLCFIFNALFQSIVYYYIYIYSIYLYYNILTPIITNKY